MRLYPWLDLAVRGIVSKIGQCMCCRGRMTDFEAPTFQERWRNQSVVYEILYGSASFLAKVRSHFIYTWLCHFIIHIRNTDPTPYVVCYGCTLQNGQRHSTGGSA